MAEGCFIRVMPISLQGPAPMAAAPVAAAPVTADAVKEDWPIETVLVVSF